MRRLAVALCALALGALTSRTVDAQQATTENIELAKLKARQLANSGAEHFEAGRYAEALDAFRQAEQHFHAPTILLMAARCHDRLGQLLEARSTYDRVISEPLKTWAPKPFRDAQETAKQEREAIARRIPTLQVRVSGADASAVTLSVNGTPVAVTGERVEMDPGRVVVSASVAGRSPVDRVVTLREGQREELVIDLSPPRAAAAPAPARGSLVPAYIAFGAAGLGIGVGAVTGVIAKVQVDDIKSRCTDDGHCPRADQPNADRAQTFITVSTVGLVAGGIAAAAGMTLLVLRPGGGGGAANASKDAAAVRLVVGPGSAQVLGRF